jgi:hypothetical protein
MPSMLLSDVDVLLGLSGIRVVAAEQRFGGDAGVWRWFQARSGGDERPGWDGFGLAGHGSWSERLLVTPNVRVEAGPTVLYLAREAHHVPRRLAGQVQCRWASPPTRG